MPKKILSIGTRYGSWTVVDHTVNNRHLMSQVVCECDCGKFAVVISANLRAGATKRCNSCGRHHGTPIQSRLTEDQVQELRRRLRAGEGVTALAKEYQVERSTIHQLDRGMTWRHIAWPDGLQPREDRPPNKLNVEQVLDIKRRLAQGEKQISISRDYPFITYKNISAIWRGETFKQVPWPADFDTSLAGQRYNRVPR